jgi:hypothetical protein
MASVEPHELRITTGGKIENWVKFALDFLQVRSRLRSPPPHARETADQRQREENAMRPLILHTLPAKKNPTADATEPLVRDAPPDSSPYPALTIPRLISVVEIIKREYLKALDATHPPVLTGLHQYNELGSLETKSSVLEPAVDDSVRAEMLIRALEGNKCVSKSLCSFFKIIYSP